MPNMTLSIPNDLHSFVKKHNEINWSEIARRAMAAQARKLLLMEKLVKNSEFSELDVEKIDKKVKSRLMKRFSR